MNHPKIHVIHADTREFIYPIKRDTLQVKLQCLAEGTCRVSMVFWKRFDEKNRQQISLDNYQWNGTSSYFFASIQFLETVHYIIYYFEIVVDGHLYYASPTGVSSSRPNAYYNYQSTNELDVYETPRWAQGSIGYHIFVERFYHSEKTLAQVPLQPWDTLPTRTNFMGGNLQGIIEKLDYLSSLHVEVICLTPIFKSPSNHKYDTTDYFSIDPSFGTKEDLINLVENAHRLGMKIILDGVFNHIGYSSPQFQDVIQHGSQSSYWDWFYIQGSSVSSTPLNYECVGDYMAMPKLRHAYPAVREFIKSIGTYWITTAGIDGWRLDVADEVDFTLWHEFRRAIKQCKPEALLIGETWRDGRDMLRGDQMDTIMNYKFRDSALEFFVHGTIDVTTFSNRIETFLFNYPVPTHGILYNLLGSHDTARLMTVAKQELKAVKLAIAFQMTFPGMPMIYYGDELGMTGENDPGCRAAMKWDDIDNELSKFFRQMIVLRYRHSALKKGEFRHFGTDLRVYGFIRSNDDETLLALFNRELEGFDYTFELPMKGGKTLHTTLFLGAQSFHLLSADYKKDETMIHVLVKE